MLRRKELVIEPHFHYWPEINHVPSDSYLAGYWQSEKYFQKHNQIYKSDNILILYEGREINPKDKFLNFLKDQGAKLEFLKI